MKVSSHTSQTELKAKQPNKLEIMTLLKVQYYAVDYLQMVVTILMEIKMNFIKAGIQLYIKSKMLKT